MNASRSRRGERTGRLASALVLAATVLLGSGAPGATAAEPAAGVMLRTIDPAPGILGVNNQPITTLRPTAVKSVYARRTGESELELGGPLGSASVGWAQAEYDFNDDVVVISETAVKFDLAALGANRVTRAILRFDEQAGTWTSGSGAYEPKEGCVARLGIATSDWANQEVSGSFPNEIYSEADDGSARSWTLTNFVQQAVASPRDESLHYGFVLRGALSFADLNGDDSTSCTSQVSNFRLEVTQEAPRPDLSVERVEVKDKSGAVGCTTGSVNVTAALRNTGNQGVAYDVLLQVDGTGVERVYTSLQPGQSKSVSFATVDLGVGAHKIEVIADPDGEKRERSEGNNMRSTTVTCSRGAEAKPEAKPLDLQVARVAVQKSDNSNGCVAGATNQVHVVVRNTGDAETSATITIDLSVDGEVVKSITMGGIGKPPSNTKDAYFSKVDLSEGRHTIQVTVNADGKVAEADDSNNTSALQTVTCTKS